MKKFNVFVIIITVFFASSFIAKELDAQTTGNKWEIKSVTCPKTCGLNGHQLTFKVKIKNISGAISTNDKVTIKITITHNGQNMTGEEIYNFGSNGEFFGIGVGKTTTFSVLCTNENFRQFTNTTGNKSISASFQLITETTVPAIIKNFTIKVK